MALEQEIEELEREIRETSKNKATESHLGRLKAKLADKKAQVERQSSSGGGGGYGVRKSGDATVALVGFPSVGKSTLLNVLTNAESEVGEYAFTTLGVTPGMLHLHGANIQILDLPGLIEGASSGRGRGREVLSVVRTADLVVFVLDAQHIQLYSTLLSELHENRIRINATPPQIKISRTSRGGITIFHSVDLGLEESTIKGVLMEYGIANADVTIRETLDLDSLIDGIMGNCVYKKSLVVINKSDSISTSTFNAISNELMDYGVSPECILHISAKEELGIVEFKDAIWDSLGFIRIYMDKPGRGPDYEEPLILQKGATVKDACHELGGDFLATFRFARITGPSAKHDDQIVGIDHELLEEDVLRLVLKRQ
ncbi:MAG TPA: GTP-binding protein [Halobacteriales archaeon]|nr:GTP-binding protein [Halobacteriales archaeon]